MHKSSRLYKVKHIDDAQVDQELDEELSHLPMGERLKTIMHDKNSREVERIVYVAEAPEKYDIFISISTTEYKTFHVSIEKKQFDLNPSQPKYAPRFQLGHITLDLDELCTMHRAISDCLRHNLNLETGLKDFYREKTKVPETFSKLNSTIIPYPSARGGDSDFDSVSGKSSDDEENATTLKSELQKAKTNLQFRRFLSTKNKGQTSGPKNRLDALQNLSGEAVVSYAAVDMWIKLTVSRFSEKEAGEIILMPTNFCSTLAKKEYSYEKDGKKLGEGISLLTKTIKLLIAPCRYENGDWVLVVAKFDRGNLCYGIEDVTNIYINLLEPRYTRSIAIDAEENVEKWIKNVLKTKYRNEPSVSVDGCMDLRENVHFPKTLLSILGAEQNDDGIFVCMYISYICSGIEIDFLPTDMKLLRKWVEFELRQNTRIAPLDNYPPDIDETIEDSD
jgi:hypothetical protein